MNDFPSVRPAPPEPSEEEIRACAYRLYQESGCVPGHDLENWLKAAAHLRAEISARPPGAQPPGPVNRPGPIELRAVTIGAGTLFP